MIKWLIATLITILNPATWFVLKELFIFIFKTFKTLILIMLQLGIKGIPSILLSWLLISGSGLIGLGFILNNNKLKVIGLTIYAFWLTPIPLNLFIIAVALAIQRFIFRDKQVSLEMVKTAFKKGFGKA